MDDRSSRELRSRQAAIIDAFDLAGGPVPSSGASLVVRTVTVTTYPTAAGLYYGVQSVDPGGAEVEGGAASLDLVDGVFYVAVLTGSTAPPVGTNFIADAVGGRWVART